MASDASPALQRLLWERIEGYAQLELLLLLWQHTAESWSAEEVSLQLKLPHGEAEEALGSLMKHRLVEKSVTDPFRYRYCPLDPEAEVGVQELARAWQHDRLEVIRLMNSHAITRIRNAALRTFSNAFRLRGTDND